LLEAKFLVAGGKADSASVVSQSSAARLLLASAVTGCPAPRRLPARHSCYAWVPTTLLVSLFAVSDQQTSGTLSDADGGARYLKGVA
jgi:hypothetical protein